MSALPQNTTLYKGKYKIIKTLGQGGFGITYLAENVINGSKIAIKEFFLKRDNFRSSDGKKVSCSLNKESQNDVNHFRNKFIREAKKLKSINSNKIVRVFDIFDENNTSYYVMEYIEGQNLSQYIKNYNIDENEAIEIITKSANALNVLHTLKILHLDIKPQNIMRKNNGEIVLIDFGLSKIFDENGEIQDSSISIGAGSPGYSPLEQENFNGLFTPTLDIYALGATFYKLLTSKNPPKSSEIANEKTFNNFINKITQKYSKKVVSVIKNAMQPYPKDRFQTVDEFINALPKIKKPNETIIETVEIPADGKWHTFVVDEQKNNNKPNKKTLSNFVLTTFFILLCIATVYLLICYLTAKNDTHGINEIENTIQDLKENKKQPEIQLKEYTKSIDNLDKLIELYKKHLFLGFAYKYYHKPNIKTTWHNLRDAYENEFKKNNPPVIIKDIEFKNNTKDGHTIDDYGATLYASNIQYLHPRLKIISLRHRATISLSSKVYKDTSLCTNNKSPSGYTLSKDVNICNHTKIIDVGSWGNDKKTSYKNVDSVRWEIWYNDKKLGEKTIKLIK